MVSTSSDTRALLVTESGPNLTTLSKNGYNLQVAKSVIRNGQRMYLGSFNGVKIPNCSRSDIQFGLAVPCPRSKNHRAVETKIRVELDNGSSQI